jgi:hypothetical protein
MSSRKRNRQTASSAAAEDGQCTIKLADASLPADFTALRACSSCARGLPADAQEWDISGLQVDGQPVSRATAEAWLACVDSVLGGSPLDGSKKEQLSTATGLQQLLLFADAVGSVGGVLNVCLSELQNLKMLVKVGSEIIELCMGRDAGGYRVDDITGSRDLHMATLYDDIDTECVKFANNKEELDFRQQVATQTEALLYVGHLLQQSQLLQTVHGFVFRSHVLVDGIFRANVAKVFTERVLAAAVGSNQLSRDAYVTSVLTHPCSAHGKTGLHQLLKGVQNPRYDNASEELRWDAQLAGDFFGVAAGSQANVQLDVLSSGGPVIKFAEAGPWLRVQILLGHGIFNEQDRHTYLQENAAE